SSFLAILVPPLLDWIPLGTRASIYVAGEFSSESCCLSRVGTLQRLRSSNCPACRNEGCRTCDLRNVTSRDMRAHDGGIRGTLLLLNVVAETNGAYSTDRAVTSGRARPFCRRTQLKRA